MQSPPIAQLAFLALEKSQCSRHIAWPMPKPTPSSPPQTTLFAVKSTRPKTSSATSDSTEELDLFATASTSNASGYEAWQRQQQEQKKAFEKKWGLPLGCRVRIQLTTQGRPIEGIIRLATDNPNDANRKDRFLRIQDTTFSPREVESLTRV